MSVLLTHEFDCSSCIISAHFLDNCIEVAWKGRLLVHELCCLHQKIVCKSSDFRVSDTKHKMDVRAVVKNCNRGHSLDWQRFIFQHVIFAFLLHELKVDVPHWR